MTIVIEHAFLVGIKSFIKIFYGTLKIINIELCIKFFHFVQYRGNDLQDFCWNLVYAYFFAGD